MQLKDVTLSCYCHMSAVLLVWDVHCNPDAFAFAPGVILTGGNPTLQRFAADVTAIALNGIYCGLQSHRLLYENRASIKRSKSQYQESLSQYWH